jgi:GT2 family glycosyltransferase
MLVGRPLDDPRPTLPPDPAPVALTIVLVNYHARKYLLACLESLQAAPPPVNYRIVLVDNSPGDGTAAVIQEHFPEVEVLTNPANLGFAAANNRVLRTVSTPYIMLLNPDTEVQPGAISTLLTVLDRHPEVAAVGPRLLYPDGRYQHSAFRLPRFTQATLCFFELAPIDSPQNGRYPEPTSADPRPVEHLLGACLLIRLEALRQIGLFDEQFFMYFEETDWCARAIRAGWQLWQVPAATVIHHGGGTTRHVPEEMSLQFHRSQALFYRKHYGTPGYMGLKAIVLLGLAYRLARSLVATVRGRIDTALLMTRLRNSMEIARA